MKVPKFVSTNALALAGLVSRNAALAEEQTFAKLQAMCKDVKDLLK